MRTTMVKIYMVMVSTVIGGVEQQQEEEEEEEEELQYRYCRRCGTVFVYTGLHFVSIAITCNSPRNPRPEDFCFPLLWTSSFVPPDGRPSAPMASVPAEA